MKSRLLAIFVLFALTAGGAAATSYLPITDRALYQQAPAVAQVSVLSVGPAPARGVPAIDYIVLVERLLKGKIAGSTVVVRVAGGVGPDGWGLELVGAPAFAQGDRAILFLVPQDDGTYGILHLMLGAFHEFRTEREHLALRDLFEAQDVTSQASSAVLPPAAPRDFEAFADWLDAGAPDDGAYRVTASERAIARWREAFALLRQERRRLRWFDSEVEWMLGRSAPPGSRRLLKEALRAWDPLLELRLTYGGRTEAHGRLDTFDDFNVVAFGDLDHTIPGSFSCHDGGVVAVGGPWFDPELTAKSRPGAGNSVAIRILGADIMLNDGSECLLSGFETISREVLMHELGHALGLGFACGDSASGPCGERDENSVMRALVHTDGEDRRPGHLEHRRLENLD
jgi:hypothetical protein